MNQVSALTPLSMTELANPSAERQSHSYSCLICRQRKIRCDRIEPCSNCVKASRSCNFVPPVRGKRKRTKPPKEGLHAKLRRYEDLLKSYGAKVEPTEDDSDSSTESYSQLGVDMNEDTSLQDRSVHMSSPPEATKPKLDHRAGSTRYFEGCLGPNLGREARYHYPDKSRVCGVLDRSNALESDLVLESPERHGLASCCRSDIEDPGSLHPPEHVLLKLRDIYVDRIDPLAKIIHFPTFWASLTDAIQHPQNVSKGLEALIWAFYLTTIASLEENECGELFAGPKSDMSARYERATRQALKAARFLYNYNLVILQAYTMYLMGVRDMHRSETLFILSGIAMRLAQRIGLHRDLGFSPFETEIRRRLWWNINHMDYKLADLLEVKPSMDIFSGDVKRPLNLTDDALYPDMVQLPPETNGITSITICLLRCDFVDFFRKFPGPFPNIGGFGVLTNPGISLAKKDAAINHLEDLLERKYLRYCDPSNPHHYLVMIVVRSAMCKMRLSAHTPRRVANRDVQYSQSERDIVYKNATKLLEYVGLLRDNLDKYMWLVGTSFIWNATLYVLIEARHRKLGPEVDRIWVLIGDVLSKYPEMFQRETDPVFATLGDRILEIWAYYLAAAKAAGLSAPMTPEYISAIRRCRAPAAPSSLEEERGDITKLATNVLNTPNTIGTHGNAQATSNYEKDHPLPDLGPFASSYDFSNILSFEPEPDDWLHWENLIAEDSLVQPDTT